MGFEDERIGIKAPVEAAEEPGQRGWDARARQTGKFIVFSWPTGWRPSASRQVMSGGHLAIRALLQPDADPDGGGPHARPSRSDPAAAPVPWNVDESTRCGRATPSASRAGGGTGALANRG